MDFCRAWESDHTQQLRDYFESAFSHNPSFRHPGQAVYQSGDKSPWNVMSENASLSGHITHIDNHPVSIITSKGPAEFYETSLIIGNMDHVYTTCLSAKNELKKAPLNIRIPGLETRKEDTFDFAQGSSEPLKLSFLSAQPLELEFGQKISIMQIREGVVMNGTLVSPAFSPPASRTAPRFVPDDGGVVQPEQTETTPLLSSVPEYHASSSSAQGSLITSAPVAQRPMSATPQQATSAVLPSNHAATWGTKIKVMKNVLDCCMPCLKKTPRGGALEGVISENPRLFQGQHPTAPAQTPLSEAMGR